MVNYKNIAVILAAGNGSRFGSKLAKQYHVINSRAVIYWSMKAFIDHPNIDAVAVVIAKQHLELFKQVVDNLSFIGPIIGGTTRFSSVVAALDYLKQYNPQNILIHDGCRPFVSHNLITNLLSSASSVDCVVPITPVTSTIKKVMDSKVTTIDRQHLFTAQTPQLIKFGKAKKLYNNTYLTDFTDDSALFEHYGCKLEIIPGEVKNIKITTQADFEMVKNFIHQTEIRTGIGFDAHKFIDNLSSNKNIVMLGGVMVPCDKAISAHSDGDVLIHAIVDAMLGAVAAGDIGDHFPPSDKKWCDVSSSVFLRYANDLIRAKGGKVINIDTTVICEMPKLTQYKQNIIASLSDLIDLNINRISVKATTTEKMGFTGRAEGIAAQAIVTIEI